MSSNAIKEKIDDLYFVFQPIIQAVSSLEQDVCSYEVLLRSKENSSFPFELFMTLIADEDSNELLLEQYTEMVYDYMERIPNADLSLNLHPQQLTYESTWEFLKSIQMYSDRITIEFTEFPPEDYTRRVFSTRQWMNQINEMGFTIALDDVDCGLNSMQFVMEHIDVLSSIKFSILPFRKMNRSTLLHFLKGWIEIARHHQVKLVVEAVEDAELAAKLHEMGVIFQQGYFWGRGRRL
ncbi:EAL domain-containing protein [Jeotgalibaca ciconiae]|uniref:EAL domain-containing protein n=1 Tax=Jeotgalibaca ciconiae TaxID=2496265 RepID=UPI0013DF9E2C|nr:EAL domain-containing protein [Jeotgalibaca ciconiae]